MMQDLVHPGWRLGILAAAFYSTAAIPPIPEQARTAMDRALNAKGTYVAEESAYTFTFPRTDISLQVGQQRLTPAQSPRSWATFSPSVHHEGVISGEIIVLEQEVNPVMSAALNAGLEVTGLGATLLFDRPRLLAMNVQGEGTFQTLAGALKKTLDALAHSRSDRDEPSSRVASGPVANAIDAAPLNRVLSMRGIAADGIFRAAIGRIVLIDGTPLGREMGQRTSIEIFGSNDNAFAQAEIIAGPDELRRLLRALQTRDFTVTSIRNHAVRAHPESLFVRVWKQGRALDLARDLRYVLDVEVGAVKLEASSN